VALTTKLDPFSDDRYNRIANEYVLLRYKFVNFSQILESRVEKHRAVVIPELVNLSCWWCESIL